MKSREQLVQGVYAAIGDGCDVSSVRADVARLLDLVSAESETDWMACVQRHPLGFLACKWDLGEGQHLRVHLWDANFAWAQDPDYEVHDHVFSFRSLVLRGEVMNVTFEIGQAPGSYALYAVGYEGPASSLLKIQDGVSLHQTSVSVERAGSCYKLGAGILHSSALVADRAVTVLATSSHELSCAVARVVGMGGGGHLVFDRSAMPRHQYAGALTSFAADLREG